MLTTALFYIIKFTFEICIFIVLLRFILQLVRADFYNPLSQFIFMVSNPILTPIRRIIPGYFGIDIASIVLLITLIMIEFALFSLLGNHLPHILGLFLYAIAKLISHFIYFFIYCIIIDVILSWISLLFIMKRNDITPLITSINRPILTPIRRLIPSVYGIDFAPMIALLTLLIVHDALVAPIMKTSQALI